MAKAKKEAGKEVIVVRECMEADAVLQPDRKGAATEARVAWLGGAADDTAVACAVRERWGRAQRGLAEILMFGATLLDVQAWLEAGGSPRRGPGSGGLKTFLAERCPEVNYKTAYGYMCAAAGLRREAKLAEDVPLLALMGEEPVAESRLEKMRQRVAKVIGEASISLLKEAGRSPAEHAPKGGARDGAGRPAAERGDSTVAAGAAWAKIGSEIDRATAWHFERFLPEAITREAMSTIKLLQEALAARMAEFGKGK